MRIYCDIETIPSATPPSLKQIKAPANYKDPEKIKAWKEANQESVWRKESLDLLRLRVLCVGFAIDDGPVQCVGGSDNDCENMKAFADAILPVNRPFKLIGHNGRKFDFSAMRLRALKYGIYSLAEHIGLDKYHGNVDDTMEMMGGGYGSFFGLDAACRFFRVQGKTEGMGGDKVFDYWRAGRIDEIMSYCKEDVAATRRLYKKLKGEQI